jgi:hypothetical protein
MKICLFPIRSRLGFILRLKRRVRLVEHLSRSCLRGYFSRPVLTASTYRGPDGNLVPSLASRCRHPAFIRTAPSFCSHSGHTLFNRVTFWHPFCLKFCYSILSDGSGHKSIPRGHQERTMGGFFLIRMGSLHEGHGFYGMTYEVTQQMIADRNASAWPICVA